MSGVISIRPSKDLRNNYNNISQLSRSNPVAITVNGKEDIGVISHEEYMKQQRMIDEMESRLYMYDHLAQATDDIKLGRVQDSEQVYDNLLNDLDELNL